MINKVVAVHWRDATSLRDWASIEEAEAHEPTRCYSVGLLIKRDAQSVVLALTLNEDRHVGEVLAIPRAWVTKIETLKTLKRGSL